MKLVINGLLIIGLLAPSFVSAITATDSQLEPVEVAQVQAEDDGKVLLLSWQGDYLRTTAGTVYVKGVVVNNLTGMEQSELANSRELAEVILVENGNIIEQINIVNAK